MADVAISYTEVPYWRCQSGLPDASSRRSQALLLELAACSHRPVIRYPPPAVCRTDRAYGFPFAAYSRCHWLLPPASTLTAHAVLLGPNPVAMHPPSLVAATPLNSSTLSAVP